MKPKTFAIVGLGLMGGSLGFALKKKFRGSTVVGVSRSGAKVRWAKRRRMIDCGTTDIRRGVEEADMVFVCTPVSSAPRFAEKIDLYAKKGCIVTDVGSTKAFLTNWALRKRLKNIRFIGSHPMAGSHETGLKYARKGLYDKSLVFITPGAECEKSALNTLVNVWKRICARVFICDARRHDKIVARTSHLPHVLASLLVLSVNPSLYPFTAAGFRDTTRIAQGDPELWCDIFSTNRVNLIKLLEQYRKSLGHAVSLLKRNDLRGIKAMLSRASERRRSLVC